MGTLHPHHGGRTLRDGETTAEPALARDRGLVRGMGTLGLAANVVNNVIGSALFTLPAAIALQAGAGAPLVFLISAIIVAGVVTCFAETGSRVPTSGGAYGTVEAAFGPAAGLVAGMLFLVSNVLSDGGIAAAIADSVATLLPGFASGAPRTALIAAIFALVAAANLTAVRTTTRIVSAAAALKLVPLLLFVALGAATIFLPTPPGPPPPAMTADGFFRAIVLAVWAFSGYETALLASGEIRDPARTLPRGLFLAMAAILCLYLTVQLTAGHLLGGALATARAPLAEAAARVSPLLGHVLLAGAAISMLGFMVSDVLGSSRLLFAFARDGALPAWLGALDPRRAVPARAVLCYAVAGFGLAISGTFLELVFLSALNTVMVYAFVCLAAVRLARRGVALAGPPLGFPALPAACVLGLLGVAALLAGARLIELGGLAATAAVALVLHRLRRPPIPTPPLP